MAPKVIRINVFYYHPFSSPPVGNQNVVTIKREPKSRDPRSYTNVSPILLDWLADIVDLAANDRDIGQITAYKDGWGWGDRWH